MSSDENGWYLARHTQKSFDKLPIESAGADPAVAIPGTGRNATNANARETQRLSIEDLFHPNTRKEFPLEYRHRRRTGGPTAVLGNSKKSFSIYVEQGILLHPAKPQRPLLRASELSTKSTGQHTSCNLRSR